MLQGRPWALFQQALGRQATWMEETSWSWIGYVIRNRAASHLYVPYGPTVGGPTDLSPALAGLHQAARRLKVDFVRCEPIGVDRTAAERRGLLSVEIMQPARTLMVDLSQTEDELRHGVTSSTRNTINRAQKIGIDLTITTDFEAIPEVIHLLKSAAAERHFRSHDAIYYDTLLRTLLPMGAAAIGLARHEGKIISAAVALDDRDTRAYAHAGNEPEARKLRSSAPLVWRLMLDAKERGLTRFDLWGVAPPGAPATDAWSGFSEFKRYFGGEDIEYAGTWELPVRNTRYKAIRLAKRGAVLLRRR